ncbi:MAG: CoA pyrophosphatase [Desulfobacteraceae bacterium]|jgi:8-oxo-dGTP pyrophosphatase MutT (NUDIX family)
MKINITEKIRSALINRVPLEIDNQSGELIDSAVLIPIFETSNGYEVLFTERTHKVEHHKGQISFPGGAVDPEDKDFEETALRESYEEVGLLRDDVKVLGRLDDQLTIASSFIIHPFVGEIPHPYNFEMNQDEVERIISVPLDLFFEENSDRHPNSIKFETFTYRGPVYCYGDITIWGATAIMMSKFVRVLDGNKSLPGKYE